MRSMLTAVQAFHTPPGVRVKLTTVAKSFHSSSSLQLNRFLLDADEVDSEGKALLSKDDYRTIHAAKILAVENGDSLRAGIVSRSSSTAITTTEAEGGLLTDRAIVEWIPEHPVKKSQVLANGNPPGSLQLTLYNLTAPSSNRYPPLNVDLILALPRPLQLGRVLPMIAQMGVGKLVLTGAQKVPKDYFGSHLFRKPKQLTEKLIEGLCQAGDVRMPTLHISKNLRSFLRNDLDLLFPSDEYARVLAHPQRPDVTQQQQPLRMMDVIFPKEEEKKMVVCVGPEGGWEEPGELDRFAQLGFQQVTLGPRTLRTDVAVVSLLSLANEVVKS